MRQTVADLRRQRVERFLNGFGRVGILPTNPVELWKPPPTPEFPGRSSGTLQRQVPAASVNQSLTIGAQCHLTSRQCHLRWGLFVTVVDSPYVLSLTGSLTTPRAEAIHLEVLAALNGHSRVTVDCSSASEMDVAFIQILVAADRFASQRGKTIALASPPAGLLAETLRRCGFSAPKRPTATLAEVLTQLSA